MRRLRGLGRWIGLVVFIVFMMALVLRQGLLPAGWSPLPALDLAQPDAWLIDFRLADLRHNRALCRRVLRAPQIQSAPVRDQPIRDGCGWTNAVRVASAGGASLSLEQASCELAAALALWLAHEVQARAEHIFGSRVVSVQHLGGYACRNIAGSRWLSGVRSEHATANAIDITGFTLANGLRVSVREHWAKGGREARFLREILDRACRYFRVAIGPDFNAAHHDHFHFDRGPFSRCK